MTELRRAIDRALVARTRLDADKSRQAVKAENIRRAINPQFDTSVSTTEARNNGIE